MLGMSLILERGHVSRSQSNTLREEEESQKQRETADATRRLGDPWITRGSAKSSVSDFRQSEAAKPERRRSSCTFVFFRARRANERFDRSSSTTTVSKYLKSIYVFLDVTITLQRDQR
ncbi:uncharacterized protein LOC122628314 isoform X3 [Vespula pensylvanica]|uniref:uncharacterized protein LOC122628314 isoform X3 n=1 Tax=Vespula pensylvanica TaxID=30213 RepID=UPI001CBA0AA9|nr:uncharacterized protein LOC122628314 isoform X3 [Vespula pensylvanica]